MLTDLLKEIHDKLDLSYDDMTFIEKKLTNFGWSVVADSKIREELFTHTSIYGNNQPKQE